ncbi:MAG: hypothetical protein H6685_12020 [Deltaproteobacteria bacterium]|nr:hypothetical protein [Deltaproteobacteria bacterium]
MVLLSLVVGVTACGGDDDDDDDQAADDDDIDDDDADDDTSDDDLGDDDTGDDDTEPSPFKHTVFTYTIDDEIDDAATGKFDEPSYAYPPVDFDAGKYKYMMTFFIDPMMPPFYEPIPSQGPLVLWSDDLDVIVFSPMDHFFDTVIMRGEGEIEHGLQGELETIPAGTTHRFLMVEGPGINATIEEWGRLMREDHGKTVPDRYADMGLSYLGYWTDNGGYYYYNTEPGMNEEDTMFAVKDDADDRDIPIRYMQLDSWWYYKEEGGPLTGASGLLLWEPKPEMFPDGLTDFQEEIDLPLILHNRWFSPNNWYLDDYDFYANEDDKMVLPMGQDLFDHFMADAKSWGVITYEQDWLVTQFWGVTWMRNGLGHARQYMDWLTGAVDDAGLTMQNCMSSPAHMMDVLDRGEIITTLRTSIDYHINWSKESFWPQFHTVNMIAKAVGVWPFKDNFQSNEDEGEAEALISSLSAGMVGPSDEVGEMRREILMHTCMEDGLLLKPDVPATPVDPMFLPNARPYTVSTYSDRGDLGRWNYIAAFHIASEHPDRSIFDRGYAAIGYGFSDVGKMFNFPAEVTDWSLDLSRDLGIDEAMVLYNWRTGEATQVSGPYEMAPFEDLYDHGYFVAAPIFENGLSLIGETGKFVTVADKRFLAIEPKADAIDLTLAGVPGEKITVAAYDTTTDEMIEKSITFDATGQAEVTLAR